MEEGDEESHSSEDGSDRDNKSTTASERGDGGPGWLSEERSRVAISRGDSGGASWSLGLDRLQRLKRPRKRRFPIATWISSVDGARRALEWPGFRRPKGLLRGRSRHLAQILGVRCKGRLWTASMLCVVPRPCSWLQLNAFSLCGSRSAVVSKLGVAMAHPWKGERMGSS